MFYVTLPICCGIHIANNYRREPNATLNRITSFAIPLLAATGLGFVAGRYPGNFFEGFSFTFIPYPIARALSALKSICIQHGQSLATFLHAFNSNITAIIPNPNITAITPALIFFIFKTLVFFPSHFVVAPSVAFLAYVAFGLINVVTAYPMPTMENIYSKQTMEVLCCIILVNVFFIIIYMLRLIGEYIRNHR